MNVDTLFGHLVRFIERHAMSFPESPGPISLPTADPGKRYLLYLHIPYCVALCPYCSFHRVKFERNSASRYFEFLQQEIKLVSDAGYTFDELYIGGGTPTVLPEALASTIADVRSIHPLGSVSVETNPDHLRSDALKRLRDVGVDRLSVGVQSFDNELLRAMQRLEAYGSGEENADRLMRIGDTFDTVNVDMIFNLPRQTETSLRRDLDILIDKVGADQVSFYPLMTSDITKQAMSRTMGIGDATHERRYYEIISERMLDAGYTRASAWCFSRKPGMFDEYIVDREEYVGLGSGAFSYVQGSLLASSFSIGRYMQLVESGRTGSTRRRDMSERDQMRYYLLMRLFGGSLDKHKAEERFAGRFQHKLWPELAALKAIRAISDSESTLSLTESGFYRWVVMMREFFSGINGLRGQMRYDVVRQAPLIRTGD